MNATNFSDISEADLNTPDFNSNGKNDIKSISSASQALRIAQKLEWNDSDRDIRRSRVLAAFNGSPPYCDKDLIQKAQSYRYNVSFGFLEGIIGRAVVPYNDLSINIDDLVEIEANLNDEKLKIIQAEFGKIIKKWGKWAKFISRLNQDLVLNGYNTAIFPSDYDPFPTFVEQSKGFVDERSPNDENDLEIFVWKKSYLIHELYSKISDASIAEKAGWNVDNARQALMNATPKDIWNSASSTSGMWTEVEKAIRSGSLYSSIVGGKTVDTYHIFASELDGTVTHWIVLDNVAIDKTNEKKYENVELFKKEGRFDAMRDFLVYFDMETGDGTWHGSRGLGQRGFNTHKAIDKLRCSLLDQASSSGLTILQPGDQLQQEEFTLSVVGPFAIIPPGITVNPVPIPSISNTTFAVDSLLSATSEQRIGDIVPQMQQSNLPETATAARLKAGRAELITRGNLKRYVDPLSRLMSIIVRRLLKAHSPNAYAKDFQAELKRKGLSDDDLKEIRGARNTGRIEDILGNTAANIQLIFAEFRNDPEVDQFKLKSMRIGSVLDADAADELLINDKDQTKELEAARFQELEITSMQAGLKIPASPRDNHEAHANMVLKWIGEKLQSLAQNPDPSIIPLLKVVSEHGMEHVNFLEMDKTKKQIADKLKSDMNNAVSAIKETEKQAMAVAKQAAAKAASIAVNPQQAQQAQQMQHALNVKAKTI